MKRPPDRPVGWKYDEPEEPESRKEQWYNKIPTLRELGLGILPIWYFLGFLCWFFHSVKLNSFILPVLSVNYLVSGLLPLSIVFILYPISKTKEFISSCRHDMAQCQFKAIRERRNAKKSGENVEDLDLFIEENRRSMGIQQTHYKRWTFAQAALILFSVFFYPVFVFGFTPSFMGGGAPRQARADIVAKEFSLSNLCLLTGQVGAKINGKEPATLPTHELTVHYQGPDALLVSIDGVVYELPRRHIRTVRWLD